MDPKTHFQLRVFALLNKQVQPADPRAIYDVDGLADDLWGAGRPGVDIPDSYILMRAAEHIHPRSPQKETTVTDNTIKNPEPLEVPQGTDVGVLAGTDVGFMQPLVTTPAATIPSSDEDPMVQVLRDDLVAGKSRIADNTALVFDVRYPNTHKKHHFVANHHQGVWYLSGFLEGARKVKHAALLAILSQIGVKGSIRVVTQTKVVG